VRASPAVVRRGGAGRPRLWFGGAGVGGRPRRGSAGRWHPAAPFTPVARSRSRNPASTLVADFVLLKGHQIDFDQEIA
jgi:hypothetical protein